MSKLDPLVEGYLEYVRDVKRNAAGTLRDVRCTFNKAIEAMKRIRPGVPLWKLRLEDYVLWLNQKRDAGYSERSLSKHLSHIRGLLEYAWRSGRADRNVLAGFSLRDDQVRVPPTFLTLEEAERLVHACAQRTKMDRRDRVMILMLYGCGLRTRELYSLNVGDVDLEQKEVFVRTGKGEIQRRVPVPDGVWTELLAYLAGRGGKTGPLFRTQVKGRRMSNKSVNAAVKKAAGRAHIECKVTAKTLRHTFATHLMDRGVDLGVIAMLMGHRSVAETGVYLHVLPGKPRKAVEKLVKAREEDLR